MLNSFLTPCMPTKTKKLSQSAFAVCESHDYLVRNNFLPSPFKRRFPHIGQTPRSFSSP